jgi:hypothetical protein
MGSKYFPTTEIRTSHTLSIRVGGKVIGQIQSWAPTQSRNFTPYYEVNAVTNGGISEHLPGNSTGLSVQITRYDLYREQMEQVWGNNFDISMLTDQTNPLQVQEKWYDPNVKNLDTFTDQNDFSGQVKKGWSTLKGQFTDLGKELKNPRKWNAPQVARVYVYEGFWFSSLGRRMAATDNRIVSVNATAVYSRYYRVN